MLDILCQGLLSYLSFARGPVPRRKKYRAVYTRKTLDQTLDNHAFMFKLLTEQINNHKHIKVLHLITAQTTGGSFFFLWNRSTLRASGNQDFRKVLQNKCHRGFSRGATDLEKQLPEHLFQRVSRC